MLKDQTYNERALILRVAGGDENAFATLFDYYQGKLFSVGLDLTRSPEVAEELVQNVFLNLWLKRIELPAVQSLADYVFIIMRNETYDWLSKQSRRKRLFEGFAERFPGEGTLTNEFLRDKESSDLIRHAVQLLPPQQQEVFRLIREQGLSRQEVADLLNIDPNTVKTHLSRALKTLRAWWMAHGALLLFFFSRLNNFF